MSSRYTRQFGTPPSTLFTSRDAQTSLSPRHLLQLLRGEPNAFPGQPRNIVPPVLGRPLGLLLVRRAWNTSRGRSSSQPLYTRLRTTPAHAVGLGFLFSYFVLLVY
ncbi:hypothetical protein CHARACLAT_021625 [Characodon lateralis]|uniref:Uncharacterized protein n=1 Tax=Characodon lateralis TaxID=208331 RepID=A0ABU7DW83_9TELE|nr:hypothetical protein [Characodon lateralis]